jgi:hypothetical protein
MQQPTHRMTDLFRQLGLAEGPQDIAAFLTNRGPLPPGTLLADAQIWSPAQSSFLREGLAQDADWAGLVDRLDTSLRASNPRPSPG